jgi:hypothetical protein
MNATRTRIAAVVRGMRRLIRLNQYRIERLEMELRASQSNANGLRDQLRDITHGRATYFRMEDKLSLCIDVDAKLARQNPRILEIAIETLRRDAQSKLNQQP